MTAEILNFVFKRGYKLDACDLGFNIGVSILLTDDRGKNFETEAQIILPPETVKQFAEWLLQTSCIQGQTKKWLNVFRSDRAHHHESEKKGKIWLK